MFAKWIQFFKAYPPSGGFVSPVKIVFEALHQAKSDYKDSISTLFPDHTAYLTNSGKTSLYLLFKGIGNLCESREVGIAAYTCPDVATAARRAEFKIRLLDLEENSTNICVTTDKTEGCAAVVLSNLYGIPDEVENLKDVFIIDDACQAALSFRGSKRIGLSNDKLGIFSMGRGKAYASAGGGLLLVPKSFEKLTEVIDKEFSKFEISSTLDFFRNLIKSFLYYFLEMPFFYRFILLVPGLGIGETLIDKDFQIKRGGMFEYLTLKLSVRNEQTRSFMQQNVVASYLKLFSEKLDAVKIFEKIKENNFSLIRFPVLLERTERKHLFSKQGKRLKQFGVTCSYPTLIKYYFEEESFSNFEEKTENAEDISQRIVTLPVGPYIGHLVQESIKQLITNMEN